MGTVTPAEEASCLRDVPDWRDDLCDIQAIQAGGVTALENAEVIRRQDHSVSLLLASGRGDQMKSFLVAAHSQGPGESYTVPCTHLLKSRPGKASVKDDPT